MTYSITKDGKPLDKKLYTICEKTRTFSSNEDDLVLDFSGENGWTFKTWGNCTFNTGWRCTFNTGDECTFNTESNCTFNTGDDCTFKTEGNCTFKTGWGCTFNTGWDCTFKTGSYCTFKTGWNCVAVSHLGRTKMILIKEYTEFKCNNTEFLFKVGGEYVTQDKYEMYKELIS